MKPLTTQVLMQLRFDGVDITCPIGERTWDIASDSRLRVSVYQRLLEAAQTRTSRFLDVEWLINNIEDVDFIKAIDEEIMFFNQSVLMSLSSDIFKPSLDRLLAMRLEWLEIMT